MTDRMWTRVSMYAMALAAGAAFSILFTGEVVAGDFNRASLMTLSGYSAFWVMVGAAVAAAAIGSAGRFRFLLLFPGAALYTLVAAYGPPPLFSLQRWRALIEEVGIDLYAAANTMYARPVPYDLAPGVFVVVVPMAMVLVAFATSAALYEQTPVISVAVLGLTIGVLSMISFEDGMGPFFVAYIVSAVALLLFSGAAETGGGLLRLGMLAGAAVVAVVLVVPKAPLASHTVSTGLVDWTRIGAGETSRLSVQADVGDYLSAGREAELLRVRSEEPLFWRAGSLDHFDGVRWSSTVRPGEEDGEEVASGIPTRLVVQSVQVLNARTDLVFGGYKIFKTSLDPAEVEQQADGSWISGNIFSEGDYYRVLSVVPQPTTAQLQAAGTDYPALVREKFLQLPPDTPEVVAETARRIEDRYSIATPYDAARAVERYLIYDGGFVYNLDVSYRRADWAIEEFLGEGKEGFCTQFATSMVLILRDMGIPARVVYGATTGEQIGENEYLVAGANMHTWVEAYFPGVGWYPFDPTPGFSMPSVMQANAPRPAIQGAAGSVLPENPALRQPGVPEQQEAPSPPKPSTPDRDGGSSGSVPAWPFVALALLSAVVAIPLAKRALLARGRPEDLYRDLTGRLRDVLPPAGGAIADSRSLTINEKVRLLSGAVGLREKPFEDFARTYSDYLYSAHGASRDVRGAYRRATREFGRLPLWRRALGLVNPASLLARARRSASGARAAIGKRLAAWRGKLRRS